MQTLLRVAVFVVAVFLAREAAADTAFLYCWNTSLSPPAWQPCSVLNALSTTATVASGTFDDTMTAIAALPTLAPGTQRPRGSLAGAYYVQPVWGSASGSGTQVDDTHGLPVDVKASVLPTGAALDATLASILAKLTADPATATAQATTNTDLGPPGATACATDTGSCSLNALLQRVAQRLTTLITVAGTPMQATGGVVALSSQYPSGATPITASATGTTGATTATLAGTSSKTTYICGFSITSDATAGVAGTATATGTISGTLSFVQGVAVAPAVSDLSKTFAPCVPASATNTGIAVNSVAAGIGGVTAVTTWGYQL